MGARHKEKGFGTGGAVGVPYKDGGSLKCRLKIIETPNGSRSVDCKIADGRLSKSNYEKIYGNKAKYEEAQKVIENVPYEIMETIYEIDQYTKSMINPSSEGAWNIGKMISDFLDKFPDCEFINLGNCLNEWFKSKERVKFGHTGAWIDMWRFYKMYNLDDVERVPFYYEFIDKQMKHPNVVVEQRMITYLSKIQRGSEFLDWYKSHSSHKVKSNSALGTECYKELKRYGIIDKVVPEWASSQYTDPKRMAADLKRRVRKELEAEY